MPKVKMFMFEHIGVSKFMTLVKKIDLVLKISTIRKVWCPLGVSTRRSGVV
jgi:hypothetical protein